jgi:hypothetical protein
MFIFDGGVVPAEVPAIFRLQDEEISSVRFVTLAEATAHVRPSMARRLAAAVDALAAGAPRYLQFGRSP